MDVEHAAEKYVKIVFAVNTQSSDAMTFQEFRSLVLIQPQIVSYLELIDVDEDDWCYDAVAYVLDAGIMSGVSETEFAPAGSASRAMGATVLMRIFNASSAEEAA